MVDHGGGVFYCAGKKGKSMNDVIALADGGMGEVVVHKLNGVRKKDFFGDSISYVKAAVVVECWTNVEAFAAAEVPRFSCGCIVVDYDWTPHGTDGQCWIGEVDSRLVLFGVVCGTTNSWGSCQRFRIK